MRGRYDQEGRVRQHLEIKNNDYAVNTITSVQKDALILEINKEDENERSNQIIQTNSISKCEKRQD